MRVLSIGMVTGLLLCLVSTSVCAYEETLTGPWTKSGGFIGPAVRATKLKDDFGLFGGGRLGWIVNHTFSIGAGGYALFTEMEAGDVGEDFFIETGYGGLVVEYVFNPMEVVHFSIATLIGGGDFKYEFRGNGEEEYDSDTFFVLEPEFNVMINVTRNVRLGLGGGFRYIQGLEIEEMTDKDLSSSSAGVIIKIGTF